MYHPAASENRLYVLHQNAVSPATLELLRKISALTLPGVFGLGGGTLRIGHRRSIDLDFFTNSPFDTSVILAEITCIKKG
jgi:hypothetical protein